MTRRSTRFLQILVIVVWILLIGGGVALFFVRTKSAPETGSTITDTGNTPTTPTDADTLLEDLNILPSDLTIQPSELGKSNPFSPME